MKKLSKSNRFALVGESFAGENRRGWAFGLVLTSVFLVTGCANVSQYWPFEENSETVEVEEIYKASDIAWIDPEELRIAFELPKTIDMKNQQSVLELGLGAEGSETLYARENFILIRVPERELKGKKLPTDSDPNRKLAIFRFNTDDYARVQTIIDRKKTEIEKDNDPVDLFGLTPVFCRVTKAGSNSGEKVTATVLYASEPGNDGNLLVRDLVRDRPLAGVLGDKKIKPC